MSQKHSSTYLEKLPAVVHHMFRLHCSHDYILLDRHCTVRMADRTQLCIDYSFSISCWLPHLGASAFFSFCFRYLLWNKILTLLQQIVLNPWLMIFSYWTKRNRFHAVYDALLHHAFLLSFINFFLHHVSELWHPDSYMPEPCNRTFIMICSLVSRRPHCVTSGHFLSHNIRCWVSFSLWTFLSFPEPYLYSRLSLLWDHGCLWTPGHFLFIILDSIPSGLTGLGIVVYNVFPYANPRGYLN